MRVALAASPVAVYRATRKKHDQLWNTYVMRPLAAVVVVVLGGTKVTPNQVTLLNLVIFVAAAIVLVAMPTWEGGVIGVVILEASYLFDCADGMLARHKGLASKAGHLFDFFTDESKAVLLAGSLGVRLFRTGGFGLDGTRWAPADPRFLLATIVEVIVVASAISLTNFIRRPELSGKETTVESHYEAEGPPPKKTGIRAVLGLAMTFLQFLNHYPSHIWVFAGAGRLDLLFWMYGGLNLLYLGKGWLGLFLRFGRFS